MNIPSGYADLMHEKTTAYAYLATIMPDGSPQAIPVSFDMDGSDILTETARGRVKDTNMRARPLATLVITDTRNPFRYMQIGAHVVEFAEEGALAHINRLSVKYRAKSWEPVPGQTRAIFRLRPKHISVA